MSNSPERIPTDQQTPEQSTMGQDMDKYLTESTVVEPRHGDLCTGVVIHIDDSGLLVDFGFKREGFVPVEDLQDLGEEARAAICLGATVPVFVDNPHNMDGQPILSILQAQLLEDWIKADALLQNNELYAGLVAGYNRGGLIVKFGDIRGFVPTSQIVGMPRRLREDERRRRLEGMVGKEIGLKVIEVDRMRRRLILSQRRALRAWQELKRQETIAELTEGETRHGTVSDITDFGAFVDLGGADGLVHVSELSWKRVANPRDVLRVGQEVDVFVLNVDRKQKRIALSIKKLLPDPWTLADSYYHVGQLVEGRVTRVLEFGAFVELDLGVEGLLHASEMIGTPDLQPGEVVQPNEPVLVKIIRMDCQRKRIALSAKQVRQSEWERWMAEQQAKQAAAQVPEPVAEPTIPEPEAEAEALLVDMDYPQTSADLEAEVSEETPMAAAPDLPAEDEQ